MTDVNLISEWLMPNDFLPVVGHRFTMKTKPAPGFDGTVHAQVLELDPPRRMKWSWQGGALDTMVTFTLEPSARGTRIVILHEGFAGFGPVMVSFILQLGWRKMLAVRIGPLLDRLAQA